MFWKCIEILIALRVHEQNLTARPIFIRRTLRFYVNSFFFVTFGAYFVSTHRLIGPRLITQRTEWHAGHERRGQENGVNGARSRSERKEGERCDDTIISHVRTR